MWITVTFSFISCKVFLERQKDKPNSLESVKQGNRLVLQFSKNYHCFLLVPKACGLIPFNFSGKTCNEGEFGQRERICIYMRGRVSQMGDIQAAAGIDTPPTPPPTHTHHVRELKHLKVNAMFDLNYVRPLFKAWVGLSSPSLCESTTDQPFQAVTLASGHPCLSCDVGFIRNVMVAAISMLKMKKMTSSIIIGIMTIIEIYPMIRRCDKKR